MLLIFFCLLAIYFGKFQICKMWQFLSILRQLISYNLLLVYDRFVIEKTPRRSKALKLHSFLIKLTKYKVLSNFFLLTVSLRVEYWIIWQVSAINWLKINLCSFLSILFCFITKLKSLQYKINICVETFGKLLISCNLFLLISMKIYGKSKNQKK